MHAIAVYTLYVARLSSTFTRESSTYVPNVSGRCWITASDGKKIDILTDERESVNNHLSNPMGDKAFFIVGADDITS